MRGAESEKVTGRFLSTTADWLVLLSILLFLSASVSTNFILASRQNTAQELNYSQKVVNQAEANPLMEWVFNLGSIGSIMSVLFLPALVFGLYFASRKFAHKFIVDSIAGIFFYMALANAINDASYVIASVARGG